MEDIVAAINQEGPVIECVYFMRHEVKVLVINLIFMTRVCGLTVTLGLWSIIMG